MDLGRFLSTFDGKWVWKDFTDGMLWWLNLGTPPPETKKVTTSLLAPMIESLDKWFTESVLSGVDNLTSIIVDALLSTPLYFLNSRGFMSIYMYMAKLALVSLLPIIAWFGLKYMSGKMNENELIQSMKRIFILPMFILFSPFLIKKFIAVINKISIILLKTSTIGVTYPKNLDLVMIIACIIYAYLMFKLLIYYSFRNFGIVFLVAISPLLYLLWSFPNRYDRFDMWVSEITTLFLTQLAHVVQLILLMSITRKGFDGIPSLIMQIGALLYMVKTPDWLAKYVGASLKIPDIKISKYTKYLKDPKSVWNGVRDVFKP